MTRDQTSIIRLLAFNQCWIEFKEADSRVLKTLRRLGFIQIRHARTRPGFFANVAPYPLEACLIPEASIGRRQALEIIRIVEQTNGN